MKIQVDGISAHVQRLGAGRQVLLLHGWGPGSVNLTAHLLPLAQALKDSFEVTCLDFPGHGQSGMPGEGWGVADYAAWTLQVMDQLALNQPVIIAHSFGARIALYLAAKYPHRVASLVLTGAAGLRGKTSPKAFIRGRLFKLGRGSLQLLSLIPPLKEPSQKWLRGLRAEFSSRDYLATPEALRASFSKVVGQDLRPLLGEVQQQTLLVFGEKDSATPLWMGKALEKELPSARLLVYEADDHFAYKNQLPRFVTAITCFLEEIEAAP